MKKESVDNLAATFGALSTPFRLRIIEALLDGPKPLAQLLQELGTSQPNLSQHLSLLERSGIVRKQRVGKSVHARLAEDERGERVLAWARRQLSELDELRSDLHVLRRQSSVNHLLERRSVSPKRLGAPGPEANDLELILQAALRAPDHGGLHPWRVIEFGADQREPLAELFEQEKLRRDPLVSAEDRRRAREHALRPPVLLGFVVSPHARERVPVREQWLAAGAALGNLLNATHQLGFGAIMLSGDRCFDEHLCAELGIGNDEHLAGFISIGSITQVPPARKQIGTQEVLSRWATAKTTTKAAAKNCTP